MMNLLEHLQQLLPEIQTLYSQEILDSSHSLGWNSFISSNSGEIICEGTSRDQIVSKRIAIAEAFEKALVRRIASIPNLRQRFYLDQHPSSSGFACGFERTPTRLRAICEGLERWAWSKWIDSNFIVPEILQPKLESNLAKYLLKNFSRSLFFQKQLVVHQPENFHFDFNFSVFVGDDDCGGVFAGSRVSTNREDPWEHALTEAYRNLLNYRFHKKTPFKPEEIANSIILRRVLYFGANGKQAHNQILNAKKIAWPEPKVEILEEFHTNIPSVFLFRCLFQDFKGWHLENEARFVY